MELSIIVPVYNEEDNIFLMHERIRRTVDGLAEEYPAVADYEVIFINDGSTDNSLARIRELSQKDFMM